MFHKFRGEKPVVLGNSCCKSEERRFTTLLPYPFSNFSIDKRLPILQYIAVLFGV